jgi:hypothetical protein
MYKYQRNIVLKWQHKEYNYYQLSECGMLINTLTGSKIKKVLKGYTLGFNIKGKFVSLNNLRKQFEQIKASDCPF